MFPARCAKPPCMNMLVKNVSSRGATGTNPHSCTQAEYSAPGCVAVAQRYTTTLTAISP